jgi:hypothetical protein
MTMKTMLHRGALAGLCLLALLTMPLAQAHHGWGAYDTDRPLYLEGTVTRVEWRNPHPEIILEVASPAPATDPSKVPVPSELEQLGFREVLARAQPAAPGRYTMDLAPIGRLQEWGMSAPPRQGERLIAIAFPSCSEPGTVRPVVVVLPSGTSVRQQSVRLPKGCSGAPRG